VEYFSALLLFPQILQKNLTYHLFSLQNIHDRIIQHQQGHIQAFLYCLLCCRLQMVLRLREPSSFVSMFFSCIMTWEYHSVAQFFSFPIEKFGRHL